jgi:hypothetical protein
MIRVTPSLNTELKPGIYTFTSVIFEHNNIIVSSCSGNTEVHPTTCLIRDLHPNQYQLSLLLDLPV